jgi:peroxiredoxin
METRNIMRVIPTDTMPAIDAQLVGGGEWHLAEEHPERLSLVVFYRGLFCPVCRCWVADLDLLVPDFERRGVPVIALSCDPRERAEQAVEQWDLKNLRVGYAVDPEDARKAGLYISEGRGLNPLTNTEEAMLFSEPGVFAVQADGTLYAAWVQSTPYARPQLAEILAAVGTFISSNLPDPRGAA